MTVRSAEIERFRRLAGHAQIDLWEGALEVARLVDPQEDLAAARAEIQRLAERVRSASDHPTVDTLTRVLFDQEGLTGDRESYDDPGNSSVGRVLSKKSGMPITLSIVTIEVGRRVGLRLTGVGLPGHFVVGGEDLPAGQFLDPFHAGALCDAEALELRVSTIFGSPIALPPEALAPDTPHAILLRMLFNLRRSWERREQFDDALLALDCADALVPGDSSLRRERGLLLLRTGRSEEALESLEAYVRVAQSEDAEAVTKLIQIVREGATAEGELIVNEPTAKKNFTLDEAREVLPKVQQITAQAVFQYARLTDGSESEPERQEIVRDWVRQIAAFGVEIKGLWLVDFDSGAGYYCWKYPEPALEYFHGYEEGFSGRLPLQ